MGIDKKALSERDICTKYITPAIVSAGWDLERDIREEVPFTDGRVIARGKHHTRGPQKRADYILNYQNIRLAIVEAKKNELSVGHGMQQALAYAEALQVPFVFTSNGDGFLLHDRTRTETPERYLELGEFPSPEALIRRYQEHLGLTDAELSIVTQDPYSDGSGKEPRYYQVNAITRTLEAIARGQRRILLVMATGTGKTLTAFQIIWRLWKSKTKKRILFLADRNILVDQAKTNDFKPFGNAMTKIVNRKVDKSYEIYLSLYQAVTGTEEERNIYKQFSPECWTADNTRFLPLEFATQHADHVLRSGELVMNLTAQSLKDAFLGRVCMLGNDWESCLLNQRIARLTPVEINARFCLWLFKSPLFRQFVDGLNQGTLIQHIYTTQVDAFTFGLPPIEEQGRIVAAVEHLWRLIDEIEARCLERARAAKAMVEALPLSAPARSLPAAASPPPPPTPSTARDRQHRRSHRPIT